MCEELPCVMARSLTFAVGLADDDISRFLDSDSDGDDDVGKVRRGSVGRARSPAVPLPPSNGSFTMISWTVSNNCVRAFVCAARRPYCSAHCPPLQVPPLHRATTLAAPPPPITLLTATAWRGPEQTDPSGDASRLVRHNTLCARSFCRAAAEPATWHAAAALKCDSRAAKRVPWAAGSKAGRCNTWQLRSADVCAFQFERRPLRCSSPPHAGAAQPLGCGRRVAGRERAAEAVWQLCGGRGAV